MLLLLIGKFSLCCGFRYSMTKAFCIAFVMTFFSVFDVPVFWPILLCYWIVLFVLTMRRQIAHMIKYRYIPFNIGKQVSTKHLNMVATYLFITSALKLTDFWFFDRSMVVRNLHQVAVAPVGTEAELIHRASRKRTGWG